MGPIGIGGIDKPLGLGLRIEGVSDSVVTGVSDVVPVEVAIVSVVVSFDLAPVFGLASATGTGLHCKKLGVKDLGVKDIEKGVDVVVVTVGVGKIMISGDSEVVVGTSGTGEGDGGGIVGGGWSVVTGSTGKRGCSSSSSPGILNSGKSGPKSKRVSSKKLGKFSSTGKALVSKKLT